MKARNTTSSNLETRTNVAEAFQPSKQTLHLVAFLGEFVVQGARRFDLGGTAGIIFNSITNCRVSSFSYAHASPTHYGDVKMRLLAKDPGPLRKQAFRL